MADARNVADCFLYLDGQQDGSTGVSNLKLQKLTYYAQGFHCAIFGTPLFDESIEAWAHGPVVPDLYHTFKCYGSAPIPAPEHFDENCLSESEFEVIEEVFSVFGQYAAWKLRDMTHEELPWINHEKNASPIPVTELREYFLTRIH